MKTTATEISIESYFGKDTSFLCLALMIWKIFTCTCDAVLQKQSTAFSGFKPLVIFTKSSITDV